MIDVSANHRESIIMTVLKDGVDQRGIRIGIRADVAGVVIEEKATLLHAPSVVLSARDDVHLFNMILSDIRDDKAIHARVERKAVRISEAVGKDLVHAAHPDEG